MQTLYEHYFRKGKLLYPLHASFRTTAMLITRQWYQKSIPTYILHQPDDIQGFLCNFSYQDF